MKLSASYIFLLSTIFLLLTSCVAIPELEKARQASQRNELESAYNYYLAVLKKTPNNQEALKEIEEVRATLINSVIMDADNLIKSSAQPTVSLIANAISRLDMMKQYDPKGTFLSPAIKRYQDLLSQIQNSNSERSQRARQAISSARFSSAKELIEQIRISNPQSNEVQTLLNEYNKAYLLFLEQKMTSLLKKKKIKEARGVLNQIKTLDLPSSEMKRITKKLQKYEIKEIEDEVNVMINKKQFYKAYLTILDHGYKDLLSAKLTEVIYRGGRFYLEQAKKRIEKGENSRAYLAAVKGNELDPQLTDMFETHRDTRDITLKKLQKYIAISAFGAPSDNPDAGPQFSDALISYLFRTLPYGINIVERERIDMLMTEHKREFKEVGNILNVDIIVTGNVSLMKIDKQNTESIATVRVKVGEKREPNPEYEMVARVRQNARSTTTSLPKLPPASINVPVYENYKYTKGTATIKGFANVSVRIFDTHKGSITYAQEFNADYKASDDYQDSVEPAGIVGDPLLILSDTEVTENLRNEIIKKLALVIQKQFEKRAQLFLKDAKYHLSRKEADQAIDFLAQGFLYSVKAKIDPADPDFTEIKKLIVEETERDFIGL